MEISVFLSYYSGKVIWLNYQNSSLNQCSPKWDAGRKKSQKQLLIFLLKSETSSNYLLPGNNLVWAGLREHRRCWGPQRWPKMTITSPRFGEKPRDGWNCKEEGYSFCQGPGTRDQGPGTRDQPGESRQEGHWTLFLLWSLPAPPIGQTQPDANWQESLRGVGPFAISLLGHWAGQRSGECVFRVKQRTTSTKALKMFNVWVDSGPFHPSIRHHSVPKALWSQWSGGQWNPKLISVLWQTATSVCPTKWICGLQYLVWNKKNLTKWTNALRSFLVSCKETAEWRYCCRYQGTRVWALTLLFTGYISSMIS